MRRRELRALRSVEPAPDQSAQRRRPARPIADAAYAQLFYRPRPRRLALHLDQLDGAAGSARADPQRPRTSWSRHRAQSQAQAAPQRPWTARDGRCASDGAGPSTASAMSPAAASPRASKRAATMHRAPAARPPRPRPAACPGLWPRGRAAAPTGYRRSSRRWAAGPASAARSWAHCAEAARSRARSKRSIAI